jgi:hypothetical protein
MYKPMFAGREEFDRWLATVPNGASDSKVSPSEAKKSSARRRIQARSPLPKIEDCIRKVEEKNSGRRVTEAQLQQAVRKAGLSASRKQLREARLRVEGATP